MNNYISLGTMSGTSMDGIDLSIINSDGENNTSIVDNFFSNIVRILSWN